MKATHGTAIYTGGGIYNIIGELDNGLYFFGCWDYLAIYDADVRTYDESYDDLVCYNPNWCDEHMLLFAFTEEEIEKALHDFCVRLDNEEPGLTDGYEQFSNYCAGEVTKMMDFQLV